MKKLAHHTWPQQQNLKCWVWLETHLKGERKNIGLWSKTKNFAGALGRLTRFLWHKNPLVFNVFYHSYPYLKRIKNHESILLVLHFTFNGAKNSMDVGSKWLTPRPATLSNAPAVLSPTPHRFDEIRRPLWSKA